MLVCLKYLPASTPHLSDSLAYGVAAEQTWTGEGNGTPLHYSCLETPRDGGAWWAAVYGVTQSRTHEVHREGREPLLNHAGESTLLS